MDILSWFEYSRNISSPVKSIPEMNHLKYNFNRMLISVKEYYKIRDFFVNSNHILLRLIKTQPISLSLDNDRFYDNAVDIQLYLSKSIMMTSPLKAGQVFNNNFFYGNKEVIMTNYFNADYSKIVPYWKDISAVRVLYSPTTDMNMCIPDGRVWTEEIGYSILLVNIPVLLLQYKCWLNYWKSISDDMPISNVFIYRYVLPNMLDSLIDNNYLNRFMNTYRGLNVNNNTKKHPLAINNYTTEIDRVINKNILTIKDSNIIMTNLHKHIFLLNKINAQDYLTIPNQNILRQNRWAYILAIMPHIEFAIEVCKDHKDQRYINNTINVLERLVKDNLSIVPDKELANKLNNYYEKIKAYK